MPTLLTRAGYALKAAALTWARSGAGGWGYWRGDLWGDPYGGPASGWTAPLGRDEYDPKTAAGDLLQNPVAQACLAWIQRTFPEPRLSVTREQGDEWQEVARHPLTLLLRRPNPYYSGDRLWQVTLADWWEGGNAYWRKEKDGAGRVVRLWHRKASSIKPVRDSSAEFISRYVETVDGNETTIPVADLVHFRFGQDPENEMLGWSPLAAGLANVGNLNNAALLRGALFGRMGNPGHALVPKDKEVAQLLESKPEAFFNGIREKFRQLFSRGATGSLFIPSYPAELVRMGFSPTEMDVLGSMAWDTDIICALFGLSSMVVGLPAGEEHRTFSNWETALRAAYHCNIRPSQRLFAEDLEVQLLPDFPGSEADEIEWDYTQVAALAEDENKKAERVVKLVQAKILDDDEAREELGRKPFSPEQRARQEEERQQKERERQERLRALPESRGDRAVARNGNGRAREMDEAKALVVPVRDENGHAYRPVGRAVLETALEAWDAGMEAEEDARAKRLAELEEELGDE